MEISSLQDLTDEELTRNLKRLTAEERRITAEVLRHLAEFDRRRLYHGAGSRSLWDYCLTVLHLSETEIGLRIHAARATAANPELLAMLERGETTLSAISRLAPHLAGEAREALIEKARGKTRLEVEQLVSGIAVQGEVERHRVEQTQAAVASPSLFGSSREQAETVDAGDWVRRRHPDSVTPVSDRDWRVAFIAEQAVIAKLEKAQALLCRKVPDGRLERVLDHLLEAFLENADPARRAERRRSRGQGGGAGLSQATRDAVWERDGGRCAFIGTEGRCREARFLEIDHIAPRAKGGTNAIENLRLVCRDHNQHLARQVFGNGYIDAAIQARRNLARTARLDAARGPPESG